ncbi:TIGR04141 family sporadically distributed protein [Spirillospora sp. NBC_00431]
MTVRTVYRLVDVGPDPVSMLDTLDLEQYDDLEYTVTVPEDHLGCPSLLVSGQFAIHRAPLCDDVQGLTGHNVELPRLEAAALLIAAVAGEIFAVAFGQGWRLVPDEYKDPAFGLRVAVRAVDPDQVHDVVRRRLSGRGRQDATRVASGHRIAEIGLMQYTELVRELGGRLEARRIGLPRDGEVKVVGSAGLRMPLPTEPQAFRDSLAALVNIAAAEPHPDLAFVEAIAQVREPSTLRRLDTKLDAALADPADNSVSAAVPTALMNKAAAASTYTLEIGGTRLRNLDTFTVADVRTCTSGTARPSEALRKGRVFLRGEAGESMGSATAIKWVEAWQAEGYRHYFLVEGDWYESGTDYLDSIDRDITRLIASEPSLPLPSWYPGEYERAYNERVQKELGLDQFLCLDRTTVRTRLHRYNGLEVCDLYGPSGELVCIKPADGAGPLSHLVVQALAGVQALLYEEEAREKFCAMVLAESGGTRFISPDFRPHKVVLGIHLKTGKTLTPSTLFPLSRIALANMTRSLSHDVALEVIGIPTGIGPAQRPRTSEELSRGER